MSTRKLLTNGNAFKRTDNRWGGVVGIWMSKANEKGRAFQVQQRLRSIRR